MLGLILRVNRANRTDSRGNMFTDREAGPHGARIRARARAYVCGGCTTGIGISMLDFIPIYP